MKFNMDNTMATEMKTLYEKLELVKIFLNVGPLQCCSAFVNTIATALETRKIEELIVSVVKISLSSSTEICNVKYSLKDIKGFSKSLS